MQTKRNPNKQKYAAVPLNVLIYMSWRNVKSKYLRSAITIIGVSIGVAAVCFLVSLGLGLQKLVTEEVVGNKSIKSIDISTQNSRVVKLNNDTVDKVRGLPHVESFGVLYSQAGTISLDKSKLDTVIYGVDVPYQKMASPAIVSGRIFNTDDKKAAYINRAALDAIGINEPSKVIGKDITTTIITQSTDAKGNVTSKKIDTVVQVIGVIESGTGGEIYLPATIFDKAGIGQYSQAKLIADDINSISGLRKQIESLGLETESPIDTIDQVDQIFRYFTLILLGFGAIGMVIAVLGMFNTLTISLLERTGEIGLLQALGGRKRDMRSLFIIEATLLSLLGAISGIVTAVLGGFIVNFIMSRLAQDRGINEGISIFLTPWWLILALVVFTVIVGLLVVIVPARRAERINPVDALRQQ